MTRREKIADYFVRLAGVVSRGINVMLFNGSPDESVSSRVHREGRRRAERWIDRLFFWQKAHCRDSYWWDMERAVWLIAQHQAHRCKKGGAGNGRD